MIKKILLFLACLAPWFLSSIIPLNYDYYNTINKPFFAPPRIFYPIVWTIMYILIAITIYTVIRAYKFKDIPKNYKTTLLINYIFNQSYTLIFFGLNNNFLGFVSCLGTFISALFLYEETSLLNNKISKLLQPYIILLVFATVLSLSIYLLNL
ncbi:MAG: tryptophan-rich sensory protein [Bacilli bacterium]|nr:tryptophan-rich sensory protein [Bacilli bacterium]